MGLLNTWGADNRVLDQGKIVTYSMQRFTNPEMAPWISNDDYEYHRYCSLNYQYVGMDFETAKLCAQAMITKYTREYTQGKWNENQHNYDNNPAGTRCMADIAIQHVQGGMYNVVVAVREDDSKLFLDPVQNLQAVFSAENQRNYDGY